MVKGFRTCILAVAVVAAVLVPVSGVGAGINNPYGYVMYEDQGTLRIGRAHLNDANPAVELVADTGIDADLVQIGAVAFDPEGHLAASDVQGDRIYWFDSATGATLKVLGLNHADIGAGGITFTSGGRLLMAEGDAVWDVDTTTGDLTRLVTVTDSVSSAAALCFLGETHDQLFVWSDNQATIFIVDLNDLSVFQAPGSVGVTTKAARIAVDEFGTIWALNTGGVVPAVFTIEPLTGSGTGQDTAVASDAVGLAILAPACPEGAGEPGAPDALRLDPRFTG